jgi:sterol desaturase/sphingolipid hydroxylase (fatty acid hydroxylase superfamily)
MNRIIQEIDAEDRGFGHGWISGMGSLILSVMGLATVLCFWFPQWLTVAQTRSFYVQYENVIRVVLFAVLVSAFGLALLSTLLRKQKVLGFTAMAITLLATTMGGSAATYRFEAQSDVYLGLDFFLLNLIFLGVIFIPIERIFKQVNQPIFRYEWREDLFYFLLSTLFVQTLSYLSLTPSMVALAATDWATEFRGWIAAQPFVFQFLEIMFFTDLVQYWFHRTFHQVPSLWKFHSVHHSAQAMDWLAGSRMHLLEVILLRGITTLPMYLLGFAEPILYAYIFFVYLSSVFIHSNLRIPFGFLNYVITTPRFHHWHHGLEEEAIDKNFAIHFPIIDMVFGTFHLPTERWPTGYGIGGHPVPRGFWKQFLYPFSSNRPRDQNNDAPNESSPA